MSLSPGSHADLLERPLFAHLATVRPDGSPQSSVMWFDWNGEVLRFTHTSNRQKFANLKHEPHVAISIVDPDNGYRFLEVRGVVESTEADPEGAFYRSLQERYGNVYPIHDADVRVILSVRPEKYIKVENGGVVKD
ncbi:TIGR03618 family F420-dependent PPOX class oxidoreductase [Nakamurella sp. YIM 132087]|uniref:TIGR03618 family F420-dependent PPOX class oxidoreductase n=1 Tax=Nakamurella alba TaxID=2665158 RepID=A0A7K1FEU1_9ACTN|nr:PPOX class F420-dependent oxidoreductase [Nakamurella alba]MTD12625.1 TIGR03618 family F420-dependent PPOX class oxidoreductase [Nakamurella alba]